MKNNSEERKKTTNTGFSIIEVMVAVAIISVGMFGVVSMMTQNIIVQPVNKNNLIASMLAQEGLELVRQVRDSNWIGSSTVVGFSSGIPATSTIDIGGFKSSGLDFDDSAANLYIDNNGFYSHSGATSTPFKRLLTVSSTSPEYINIKSTVRWSRNGKIYDYVAETLLYDWR